MTTPKNVISRKIKQKQNKKTLHNTAMSFPCGVWGPTIRNALVWAMLLAIRNSTENSETKPGPNDAHRGDLLVSKRHRRTSKKTWKNYDTQERKSVIPSAFPPVTADVFPH